MISKRMHKKKGQAALEFLTTYGWAILIVLVMIGALAYFGVVNPKKFLPEKCIFASGLHCEDYMVSIDTAGEIKLQLTFTNNLGKSIDVKEVNITPDLSVTEVPSCSIPGIVPTDKKGNFTCTFIGDYTKNSDIKIDVDVQYKNVGGQYTHHIGGDIVTKVQ